MKVTIIGAGLAGLSAAYWLGKRGVDVEILEQESRPAGRAVTITDPDGIDLADVGSQYFHSNYKRALKLIDEHGLRADLRKIKGYTRFFDDRVAGGTFRVNHRVPYVRAGSPLANLRQIVMGGLRMVRHYIDPYAVQKTSRIDHVPVREAVTDPLEWEFNARTLLAAGALVETDHVTVSYLQMVRLMRIILMTNYLCLNGGIGSLHMRMADRLRIRYDTAAKSILVKEDRVVGVHTANGETLRSDHVICATTPAAAAHLLPSDWQTEIGFLSEVDQPPALVVSLFLDRMLEEKVWSYVFRPDPTRVVSFCTDSAQKNPAMVPSGRSILQAWICYPRSEHFIAQDEQAVVAAVIADLKPNFPELESQLMHAHVHRVPHAIPQFPPGQIAKSAAFLSAADGRHGIEFSGDYLSGGYMECALWSAERAVNRITDRSG